MATGNGISIRFFKKSEDMVEFALFFDDVQQGPRFDLKRNRAAHYAKRLNHNLDTEHFQKWLDSDNQVHFEHKGHSFSC